MSRRTVGFPADGCVCSSFADGLRVQFLQTAVRVKPSVGETCSARYSGSKVIAFAIIQVAPRVLCSRPVVGRELFVYLLTRPEYYL